MKIILVVCASAQEEWQKELTNQYNQKISRFYDFSVHAVRSVKSHRDQKKNRIEKETEELLKFIKPDDLVLLFDEKGAAYNSLKFAKFFESKLNSGKKRILFILGGPYGVSEVLVQKAHHLVKLSEFTLNHLVAEVVALEQIYRACTIIHNLPYHNE